jgi:hypothetical protein
MGVRRAAQGVADGDPQIEDAQAGDDSANCSVGDEGCKPRRRREERIVVPGRRVPGRAADEQAEVHANDDTQESLCLLEPVGNALRSQVRTLILRGRRGEPCGWVVGRGGHRIGAGCSGSLGRARLRCRRRGRALGRLRQSLVGHYKIGAAFAAPYLNGTIADPVGQCKRPVTEAALSRIQECRQRSPAAARGTRRCPRRRWCARRDAPDRGHPRLRGGISD